MWILAATLATLTLLVGGASWLYLDGLRTGDKAGDLRWRLEWSSLLELDPIDLVPALVITLTNPGSETACAQLLHRSSRLRSRGPAQVELPRNQLVTVAPGASCRVVVRVSPRACVTLAIVLPDGTIRRHPIYLPRELSRSARAGTSHERTGRRRGWGRARGRAAERAEATTGIEPV